MNDQIAAPSPEPAESVSTPSLEDLSKEFVEEQAQSFTAQPSAPQFQSPQYQPQFEAPDPVTNQDGYKAWVLAQNQRSQQLDGTLRTLADKFTAFEQRIQQQKIDADVDRALGIVNQKWKVDKDLAEVHLEHEYRKNPTFKRIWDNRDKNPVAFEQALKIVADKRSAMFQVRQDPQIAENVRAAQSSQRTMATTKQQTQNDDWKNLSPAEFEQRWSRLVTGG